MGGMTIRFFAVTPAIRMGIPCRSAINEKADAQRTSVLQYRTVTRLCFVQEF